MYYLGIFREVFRKLTKVICQGIKYLAQVRPRHLWKILSVLHEHPNEMSWVHSG
jgi:hypothetical protein